MALDLSNVKKASSFKEQFTVRAMVIGTIGSIILTASSMFVALKASSLPWPIMFVTLFSMCLLKLMGNTNVNEINVTHTAMSAGSMVAGGLAFTIPGLFILDNNAQIGVLEIGLCTISGTILKVEELANVLQVCLDSGAKKVLLPVTSAGDIGSVPSDLVGAFSLIFYTTPQEAVFKALGVD